LARDHSNYFHSCPRTEDDFKVVQMSYCRWSSDDFKCDVYVYEDVSGGWTTHIAGRRRIGLETLPPNPYTREALEDPKWNDMYKAYHLAVGSLPMEDITLPHAGETFHDPSPGECADHLEMLRSLGYYVPQYAIDALREEQTQIGLDN